MQKFCEQMQSFLEESNTLLENANTLSKCKVSQELQKFCKQMQSFSWHKSFVSERKVSQGMQKRRQSSREI